MSELNLPELPDDYRWTVEVDEKTSGVRCYYITLERKRWLGWEILENGFSDSLTLDSLTKRAGELANRHTERLAAEKYEGAYYGDNQHRKK